MGRYFKEINDSENLIGKTFISLNDGPYLVLSMANNYTYYVKFEYSGCIRPVQKHKIIQNKVKDPMNGINPNIIHWSNLYGPFIILDFINIESHGRYKIKFIETGTEKIVGIDSIVRGTITDELSTHRTDLDMLKIQPNFYTARLNKFKNAIYVGMMSRCADINHTHYNNYGAKGVTVCDEWSCENGKLNFYNDLQFIPQYQKWARFPTIYQLDKDYKQIYLPKNQRNYSKETCMFLHRYDNSNLKTMENHNNKYYGVYPHGNKFNVYFSVDNIKYDFGSFYSEDFAAAVYNYYYEKIHPYELIPLINTNAPQYDLKEIIAESKPLTMYTVNKDDIDLDKLEQFIDNPNSLDKYYDEQNFLNTRQFNYPIMKTWENNKYLRY